MNMRLIPFLLILIFCNANTIKAMGAEHRALRLALYENEKRLNELLIKGQELKLNRLLLDAVSHLDIEKVQLALNNGADINSLNLHTTPLAIAIETYCYVASMTENKWMKLNHESKTFLAPIIKNYKANDTKMIKFLLDHGADMTIKDKDGETALKLAARLNLPNVVKLLVLHSNHIDIEKRLTAFQDALGTANEKKYPEIIDLLTQKINHENENAELYLAANQLDIETAQAALNNGANINTLNDCRTPLAVAILSIFGVVSMTDDKWKALDNESKTLRAPIIKNYHAHNTKIIKLLLDHGADMTITDKNGDTALKLATLANLPQIIELLIFYSVDIDMKKRQMIFQDALNVAQKNNNLEIINLLKNAQKNQSFTKKHEIAHQRINEYLSLNKLPISLQQNVEPLLKIQREQNVVSVIGIPTANNKCPIS